MALDLVMVLPVLFLGHYLNQNSSSLVLSLTAELYRTIRASRCVLAAWFLARSFPCLVLLSFICRMKALALAGLYSPSQFGIPVGSLGA